MDNYETIRPNTFAEQSVAQQVKPPIGPIGQKKQSSYVNRVIMCIMIICVFLLMCAGIYFAVFKNKGEELSETIQQPPPQPPPPVSQPTREDRVHNLTEQRRPPSLLPRTSAIDRANAGRTVLTPIQEEPSEEEMMRDFEQSKQRDQVIKNALEKENDTEFALTVAEDEGDDTTQQTGGDVVIDVMPTKCDFVLTAGKRVGQQCNGKCTDGTRCARHTGK